MANANTLPQVTVDFYVLGLLYFDDDLVKTEILGQERQNIVIEQFRALFPKEVVFSIKGEDKYSVLKLSEETNKHGFDELKKDDRLKNVEEIQFGYYHHRAMFNFKVRLKLNDETTLNFIRMKRENLHIFVRIKFFDVVKIEFLHTNIKLCYIYSHTLIIIPNGRHIINEDRDSIMAKGHDQAFSIRNTAFSFELLDYPYPTFSWRELFPFPYKLRTHYIRISAAGLIVYLYDNQELKEELLSNLIDAIYYGGLYEKARVDRKKMLETGTSLIPSEGWSIDLMLSIFSKCSDFVRTNITSHLAKYNVSVGIFSLIVAILAFIVTIVSLK